MTNPNRTDALLPDSYTKKPVTIRARQWFSSGHCPIWAQQAIKEFGDHFEVETLEGLMRGNTGDWIIRGIKGEIYPCKPDIFEATYTRAQPAAVEGDEPVGFIEPSFLAERRREYEANGIVMYHQPMGTYTTPVYCAHASQNAEHYKGIDDKIRNTNPDYRFYRCDSSIEGRHNLWLCLTGQAKEDWFLQGEIIDAAGNDTRQKLYVTAIGKTFEEALDAALAEIRRMENEQYLETD